MKKISEVTDKLISDPRSDFNYQTPFAIPEDATTANVINELFRIIVANFPAFKQAWPTEAEYEFAKKEWIKAFNQVGLRDIEDIQRGIDKFRLLETPFVPSPGQFLALCKKEIKPQTDTRDKEDFGLLRLERERRSEIGKAAVKDLLKHLKGTQA